MYLKITDSGFEIKDHVQSASGIYKLIAIDCSNQPIAISRLLEKDINGILYIGQSKNLRKRLTNMRRAFLPQYKSTKHIAVRRYNQMQKIVQSFPIENLVVEVVFATDPKALESVLLQEYEQVFGERPPLNKQ